VARVLTVAAAVLIAGSTVGVGTPRGDTSPVPAATRAAAQSLESKVRSLQAPQPRAGGAASPVVITENEVNSWLQVRGPEIFPTGVREPVVRVQPEHVTGAANVNFEQFSRTYGNPNDWGPKVLAAMFNGTQKVTATAKVISEKGQAKVDIESVTVGTTKLPSWLIEFVLQNYIQPRYKFDLSKPIPLPEHVSQLVLGTGQAIFLRSPVKTP
jgi:hypothetical protein